MGKEIKNASGLDASEFPIEVKETAQRFKEEFIQKLIREGKVTSEELGRFGRIQMRHPLPDDVNNVIFALDKKVALLNPKPAPTYSELPEFIINLRLITPNVPGHTEIFDFLG